MTSRFTILIRLAPLLVIATAVNTPAVDTASPASTQPASADASRPAPNLLDWQTDYPLALSRARLSGRPVLVRAGAVWCPWCGQLDREIAKPQVQTELGRWVRIYVDVDRPPREARLLAFGPVPAFRILDSAGRLVAASDGYMAADDLLEWLRAEYANAAPAMPAASTETSPAAEIIQTLIDDLDRRDPAVREAAIRRLILVPDQSAQQIVETLSQGGLARRLAALEILQEWGGPIEDLDPWQPETLTPERLEMLRKWAASSAKIAATRPTELTASQLAAAQRDIGTLLQEEVTAAQTEAIRERLARHGRLLLPQVYTALEQARTDRVRERLTSLRYRLVASDALVFAWPGGLDRLSALDVDTRHAAADELVLRCGREEEQLLLELFSDPDGLVREIALRGLQKIGGAQAAGALVRLLQDPEPNVRAAVLKQMAESPSLEIVPAIADYLRTEKDPDLVVHAVRVLRATKGKPAAEGLMEPLHHPNWQVRAEAAEGLGEILAEGQGLTLEFRKTAYARLLNLLNDSDGFVVSVAVKSLRGANLPNAADALAQAAHKHPELAAEVLELLAETTELRAKAIPHLRRFCGHEQASVRAVAITALCTAAPGNAEAELSAALADSSSRVRIAAATALLKLLEAQRPQLDDDAAVHVQAEAGLWGSIFSAFRKNSSTARDRSASQPATHPADSQPAVPAVTPQIAENERWLADFRAGTNRPRWMNGMLPPLEAMLQAEEPRERALAAVLLVAFGREEAAMPVLIAAAQLRPEWIGVASNALPWLPWADRLQFFERLAALSNGRDAAMQLAQNLAVWPDPRAAQPLWDRFAHPELTAEDAGRLLDILRPLYFGVYKYNPSAAPIERRRQAIADALPRAQSGPELQRAVALALLLGASIQEAATQAGRIVADPTATDALRCDALQIQLLATPQAAGRNLAGRILAEPHAALQAVSLRFLVLGPQNLTTLRNGTMNLYYENPAMQGRAEMPPGRPIRVTSPSHLEPRALRPLLDSPDPHVAALAGYLLATLKEPAGLDSLVRYWREQARNDQSIRRLVYRAVVALEDDNRTPLLEEVYRSFSPEDYWLREYYWTIRSMSGPNVLKLRKQIRDEVGVDRLK